MAHNVAYGYVGWDDAFNIAPPPDGLEYYLRRLPRRWLITTLGQIGTTLFNSGQYYFNPKQQLAFLWSVRDQVTFADRISRLVAGREHTILVHPEIVSTLTKYALLYGSTGDVVPSYAYEYLVRSIILLNTLYGQAHGLKSGTEDPLIFLDYELESMLANHENTSFVMARYYRFMQWAAQQSTSSDYYLPVIDDFTRFFGLSYPEYAAAASAVFASFAQRSSLEFWRQQPGTVDIDAWTINLQEKQHIVNLLAMFSLDFDEAVQKLSATSNAYGLSDLRIFVDQPLLRLEESVFACPYQGFLRNRLGPGLFFALFDQYKVVGQHLQFAQFFGRFLEEYLFSLVADGAKGREDILVFPEKRYAVRKGESKSSDIVMISGHTAAFMDVTRKRFKLDQTLCERDRDSLADDIDKAFVKKAEQIQNSIADFKQGLYTLGSVDPATITRYVPVIITEQDFPQIIALPHLIHSAVRDAGPLQDYEPLQILAAEDIEAVYQSSKSTGDLLEILVRKAANVSYRYRDLPSYLKDFEPAVIRANVDDLSLPGYDELHQLVLKKFREWGLQSNDAKTA